MKLKFSICFLLVVTVITIHSQDFGFGFGDDADSSGGGGNPITVSINGEVSASLMGFVNDFSEGASNVDLGDILDGKLNFSAKTSNAEAFINLKITPALALQSEFPINIDEAYVKAYFGDFNVEAGLRKVTWGKADSFGPLDVINPLDYSEITDLSDFMNFKIARPLVRLSYHAGSFSKIEGIFVPAFEPLRFAEKGRWVPSQMTQLYDMEILGTIINKPENTSTINYAQGGVRFTTTVKSSDFGFQYYYGRLTMPSVSMFIDPFNPIFDPRYPLDPLDPKLIPNEINFVYNPYHQIGIDYAQDLFGFNVRAEFAVNITEDLKGDDPAVNNPHLVWSLGFDRDLFWGINLNIQCNETIRLMHGEIKSPLDVEADTDITSTQIIAALTKKFLKDRLEARAAIFWQIESKDFVVLPSLTWTVDDLSVGLAAGIFGGDDKGLFGQFWKNSFIRAAVTYSF